MEPNATVSPKEFKAFYTDPMIESVKLNTRRTGVHVPVTFAEIVDVTGDLVVYYYHEGFGIWKLVGIEQ